MWGSPLLNCKDIMVTTLQKKGFFAPENVFESEIIRLFKCMGANLEVLWTFSVECW